MRVSKVVLVFLVLPLLLAPEEKKAPPAGWTEFSPKNKNYVVWFPAGGKPAESENSIVVPKAGQIRVFRAVLERKDGSLYATSEIRLPPTLAKGQPKERQDLLRDLCLEEFKGKLVEEKKVSLGTMAGREYLIKTPKGMLRFRLLGTGVLIYRQILAGTKAQVESKAAEMFFDSFTRTDSFIKKKDPIKDTPPKDKN